MNESTPAMTRRTVLRAAALSGACLALAGCAAPAPRRAERPEARSGEGPDPAPRTEAEQDGPDPNGPDPDPPAAAGALLLASLARGDEVAVVDPSLPEAEAVTRTIRVGAAPWGVGVSPDGRTGYAATAEGLAVVDLRAGSRSALVQYRHPAARIETGEYRPGGLGLAVSPDGSRVYVAVTDGGMDPGSSVLEVFDTGSGRFTGSAEVGLRPFDVLVAPDGTWAATVDHDGFTISVVDAHTLEATAHTVAPFGTEGGLASWEKPHYGAVADDGTILLPYQGLVVARLDPASGAVTTIESRADSHSHGTALAGSRLLTVGTGAFGNAAGSPNLSILDLESGEEEIVPLDRPHETVAVWRDARGAAHAAVAGGNTRDAGWDGITMIALDGTGRAAGSGRAQRRIPTPGYPQAVVAFAAG